MGQCTSSNEIFNQSKKSDRQLRTGLKFKDIEFGGFIGYSVTINNVYTPSGIDSERSRPHPTQSDHSPTVAEATQERRQGRAGEGVEQRRMGSELVEPQTEITS